MHERNFHALYQLLSAATGSASQPPTPTLAISSADLGPPSTFHYLNTSGVTTIKGVDDVAAWAATSAALTTLGLNDLERAGLSVTPPPTPALAVSSSLALAVTPTPTPILTPTVALASILNPNPNPTPQSKPQPQS